MFHALLILVLFLSVNLGISTTFIEFDVHRNSEKCLSDELGEMVTVVGMVYWDYEENEAKSTNRMDVQVQFPENNDKKVYSKDKKSQKNDHQITFHFTTRNNGEHHFCIRNRYSTTKRVTFELNVGADVRYTDVAKGMHFEPITSALIKVEFAAESVFNMLTDLEEHEQTMSKTAKETQRKVKHFSIFTILVLIAFGCWEALYLKKYFKAKKLI